MPKKGDRTPDRPHGEPVDHASGVGRGDTGRMDASASLQHDAHWRTAVWSLRVGYGGLVIAAIGLVLTLTGHTLWVLAVGVIWWLITVVITLTMFLWARHDLGDARPELWPMRMQLLSDSFGRRADT